MLQPLSLFSKLKARSIFNPSPLHNMLPLFLSLTYSLTFLDVKSAHLSLMQPNSLSYTPHHFRFSAFDLISLHLISYLCICCCLLTPWLPGKWNPGIGCWPTESRTSPWSCCFHSSETPSADDQWSPFGSSGQGRPYPCRTGCRSSGPPNNKEYHLQNVLQNNAAVLVPVTRTLSILDVLVVLLKLRWLDDEQASGRGCLSRNTSKTWQIVSLKDQTLMYFVLKTKFCFVFLIFKCNRF